MSVLSKDFFKVFTGHGRGENEQDTYLVFCKSRPPSFPLVIGRILLCKFKFLPVIF